MMCRRIFGNMESSRIDLLATQFFLPLFLSYPYSISTRRLFHLVVSGIFPPHPVRLVHNVDLGGPLVFRLDLP